MAELAQILVKFFIKAKIKAEAAAFWNSYCLVFEVTTVLQRTESHVLCHFTF